MKNFKKRLFLLFCLWTATTNCLLAQTTFLDSLAERLSNASFEESVRLKYKTGTYLNEILDIKERVKQTKQYCQIAETLKDSFHLEYAYYRLRFAYKAIDDAINANIANQKQRAVGINYGRQLGDINPNWNYKLSNNLYFLEIFRDTSREYSFAEIQANDALFTYNDTPNNADAAFHPTDVYWVKLKVRGHPTKADNYLFQISTDAYGQRSWNNIDAWIKRKDGQIETQTTGLALKKEEKTIPYPINLLNLAVGQNEEVVLFLRLEGVPTDNRPDRIEFYSVAEGFYQDFDGGYQFNGQFNISSTYRPFDANALIHPELYEEKDTTFTITSIDKNWENLSRTNILNTTPQTDKVYWMKARFIGSPIFNGPQVFHIAPYAANDLYSFDFVDVYISDKKGGFTHQRTGDRVPLKERPYYFWATFFEIDLAPTDTVDAYIRMAGADPIFLMSRIGLWHIEEASIWPSQIYKALEFGLFFGILGIQILYFLVLFFIEKERIHLFFSLLVLGLFLMYGFASENNFTFLLFPFWKGFHGQLFAIGFFLMFFGLLKFISIYFNYTNSSIFIKWIIPVYLLFLGVYILSPILYFEITDFNWFHLLANILFPFGLILSIVMAVNAKKQKNVSKPFFFIAFLPFILVFSATGIISNVLPLVLDANNQLLRYININNNWWHDLTNIGLKLSIVFMLITLAFSVGNRTNRLKEEKETALQKNLADQKERLAEQQRINQAISRFVPNEFLAALGKNNITEIALGDNTQKEVTILFTDIRSYTSLSEQMTPVENFQFVNAYNARMGPIIQQNKGFVNQYLGDGIMAIFPNTPTDALRAAIEMQQVLQNYNQTRKTEGRSAIQVGMGMHTGSLIMGITGDANRLDAATISDSVNSAARIENLTKYYGNSILLSETCLEKLDNRVAFNLRYLGQVQVKGKQAAIKIYECFDGDLPAVIDLKLATLSDFENGIQQYFNQSFATAQQAFETVLQQNPKDKTAQLFLMKTKWLANAGVTAGWTGIEMMEKQ